MTEQELDELLRRVLLDAAKLEETRETGEELTFRPTPRYQRQMRAMWADPKKWAAARKRLRWKAALRGVAMFLAVVTISFGSILAASPTARATVIRWVTEWYESHVTFRHNGPQREEAMPQYTITALPEGYAESVEERLDWPSYVSITYRNEKDPDLRIGLCYGYMQQEGAVDFVTDTSKALSVTVNRFDGWIYFPMKPDGESSLTWIDPEQNLQFIVDAAMEPDDILHIAESVSLAETEK